MFARHGQILTGESPGCAMFGRLFETLQYLVNGELGSGFHVGMLGIIGSFLFLASANFGQMDSIVDDRSSKYRRYRLRKVLSL